MSTELLESRGATTAVAAIVLQLKARYSGHPGKEGKERGVDDKLGRQQPVKHSYDPAQPFYCCRNEAG
ncbi:hypothetical protein MTO96_048649 [Rhipicephalus appendiculatus]